MVSLSLNSWSPLLLSLWVATWAGSIALIAGLGLAWWLERSQLRGKWLVEGLIMLPLVLPPTVLGYYLLLALGRQGLGPLLEQFLGIRFIFAWPGAVVAATITALPLVVQTIKPGLAAVSREIEDAARVDGCTERTLFWRIILPLIWRSVLGGALLGFLRALGEFGATLMIAGNIPGRTQTLAMAIYDAVQANDLRSANAMVLLLSLNTFFLLFIALRLTQRSKSWQ